jgi:hypothetical protein
MFLLPPGGRVSAHARRRSPREMFLSSDAISATSADARRARCRPSVGDVGRDDELMGRTSWNAVNRTHFRHLRFANA